MATIIMMLGIVLATMAVAPWLHLADTGTHRTDLMAGDEGED